MQHDAAKYLTAQGEKGGKDMSLPWLMCVYLHISLIEDDKAFCVKEKIQTKLKGSHKPIKLIRSTSKTCCV